MSKTGFMAPRGGMSKTTVIPPTGGNKTRMELPSAVAGTEDQTEGNEADLPPVVGWLVVVSGPGTGRSRELSFGLNMIGRDAKNSVSLDFGDDQISGSDHFRIAYDGKNNKYLISIGGGKNLVYIGDDPVLDARVITDGTELSVGQTVLRFVGLCGPEWSWGGEA